jgi:endonuclease/exonuclease/phosphatase family metal-dependent hydrolase
MHEQITFANLIIAEDFNYSNSRSEYFSFATSTDWCALLGEFFHNSMVMNNLTAIPTFQRYCTDAIVSLVIDFIYICDNIHHNLKDAHITHLHPSWSDHSILSINFTAGFRLLDLDYREPILFMLLIRYYIPISLRKLII